MNSLTPRSWSEARPSSPRSPCERVPHALIEFFRFSILFLSLSVSLALAQNQQAQSLIHAGQSALEAGDLDRAAEAFEQARRLAPEDLEASRGLLLTYLQQGRLKNAE